jgi:dipeptidyl aminopeptidase/acylaminoacyl peptidase
MRSKFLLSLLMCLGAGALLVHAQEVLTVRVSAPLVDAVGAYIAESAPESRVLSPDGTLLAGFDNGELCLYALPNTGVNCFPAPITVGGSPAALVWSPDSRKIAFTADVFGDLAEGDVWVFDVGLSAFSNRTDDGLLALTNDPASGVTLDYAPFWNPATGDLYFFRSQPFPSDGEQRVWSLSLQRMGANGGAPEIVLDFTTTFPQFSLHRANPRVYLDSPAAISPDGTRLALLVRGQNPDDSRNGIWVMNLNDLESRTRLTRARIGAGSPEWDSPDLMFVNGLAWTANGAGLAVTTHDETSSNAVHANVFYIDIATGRVIPLIDFSHTEATDFFAFSTDEYPLSFFVPQGVTMSPIGTAVLIYGGIPGGAGPAGLIELPVPPDDPPVVRLAHRINNAERQLTHPSSFSVNSALLGGYLFQFDR